MLKFCVPGRKDSHCLQNNNRNGREFYAEKEGFMTKKELRAAMKKQNLSLSPEERAAASGRIFRRVAESEPFGTARCVAFFCALPDEPETEEALARWGSARRIVVPRVGGDAMRFFDYVPGALRAGAFRIAEPDGDAMPCEPSEIDLIVVPVLASKW